MGRVGGAAAAGGVIFGSETSVSFVTMVVLIVVVVGKKSTASVISRTRVLVCVRAAIAAVVRCSYRIRTLLIMHYTYVTSALLVRYY